MAYNLMPSPWFTALDANGNPIAGAFLHTFEAGGTTPKVTYADAAGTENANPVVCDSSGRATVRLGTGAYRLVLHDADDVAVPGADEDNVIGYRGLDSIDQDLAGTLGETVTAGQPLYLSDGDGGRNAAQWYKTDADLAYSRMLDVAFALTAGSAGDAIQLRRSGIVTGLSGLTGGTKYYTSTTAGVIATSGVRFVGVALSTTTLLVGGAEPRGFAIESLLSDFYGAGGEPLPIDGVYAASGAIGTLYTAAGVTVNVVARLTLTNVTGTARTCFVAICPSGSGATTATYIFYDTIQPGETVVLEGPWFLDFGDTVRALAAAASAIAVRLEGSELEAQPDGFTLRVLDGVALTTAYVTQYTAAGVRAFVPAIVLTNIDTSARSVYVAAVPSGGAASAASAIFYGSLAAGESVILPGPVMQPGDFLSAQASAASVVAMRVTAVEVN